MAIRSPPSGAVRRLLGDRPSAAVSAVLVGSILFAVDALAGVPPAAPLPVVLGLAASDRPDRDSELERLASELEGVVDDLERRSAARGEGSDVRTPAADLDADAAFERDRDDELGRLSAALDELTTTVANRERRFAERERELRRTNQRLEALVEASPVAIVALDTDGTVERWNPAAERIFGWRAEAVVGGPLPFVPEDRVDEYDALRQRLLEGESLSGVETERLTRDGDLIDVSLSAAPMRDDAGEVIGIVTTLEDITERKANRRELRETNETLNAVIEASPAALVALDPEETVTLWNTAAERVFGWSEDEIVGEPLPFVPAERSDDHREIFDRLLAGETLTGVETRRETRDGDLIDVSLSAAPIRDADGEIVGTMAAIEDITERKERERRLEATSARLEALFENSPDMVNVLDTDGRIVDVNRRFCESLGYAEDELLGTEIWEHERLFDADEARAVLDETATGQRRKFEGRFRRSDGSTFPIEAHLIRIDLGDEGRFVVICRDISDRKERERDLRETKRRLELALEGTDTGVWEWDLETDDLAWTETLERFVGLEPGAFEGTVEGFRRRVHPDDWSRIETAVEEALENGELYETECRVRHEDGHWIWVDVRGQFVTDDERRRMVGIANDVTDRKERERQLREREAELQRYAEYTDDLLDAVDDVFYVIDADGDFQRWNESLAAVSGYDDDEIESMNALEFFAAADRETIADAIEDVLETGATRIEAPLLTSDGESIPYEFVASRLEDLDGNTVVTGIGRNISERKRYERDLERTTELLEQAQALASVGGWELDVRSDPPEATATDEFYRQLGLDPGSSLTPDEVISQFHPEDRDAIRTAVERAIEEGERYDLEARVRPADGETRWVRTIGRPIYEEPDGRRLSSDRTRADDGEVVKVQSSFQDITDRKERERELERYETIVQAVGDPVYTLDADGEIRFINDAIESLAGYDPAELIGSDVSEVLPPEGLERARELVRDLHREGEPYGTVETDFATADGDVIETETHVALLPMEDGEFAGTAGVVRDITDRKERERELERYETIVQAIGDPVYTLDADGEIRFINDAIEPLTGFDPETLIGRNVEEVMTPANLETARGMIRDLLEGEASAATFEMDLLTADGGVVEAENQMALLPMEDGEFAGTAGVVRDITDRKERERELERTTDLLERVQRMAKVGGWELPIDADPRTAIWTDEMYRLHDLPRDVTPDLEQTVRCYHPDDRPFVRERLETAIETETGYDFEARIRTSEGDVRWVRTISEPIYDDDGDLHKYRGTVQDVSDRKRREMALESLHETARGLLNAETEATVAELVVETAAELLEVDSASASVYLLDSETNRFEPIASTPAFVDRSGGAPPVAVGDGDSVLWTTYVTGSQTVVDDAETGDRSPLFGGDAPGGLLVPIGDYGVFVLLASPATIDDESRRLFETLVATTEAAFDRLESEANLRERDAELAARNRRLRRQIQITEIIRGIDRSLIGADGREEIERTVPRQLVEADTVAFAWIGDLDASGTALEPRTWDGDEPEYLDAVDLDLEGDSLEPAVRAARSQSPTIVENVVEGLQGEPWRRDAIDAGFQSVVAVPLTFEEYSYGVLTVYADEPDAFTDLERSVFAELGEGIANAINAAKTQEALHAETLVELTLDVEADDVLPRIAATTGGTVSYEGLGAHGGSETVLFFEVSDAPPDAVRDALEELVSVTAFRLVTESEAGCLFEATVTGDVLASRLVRHGGSPRSITADGDGTVVTVDVPVTTDVREFVEMLGEQYGGVELRSRRHVQRAMQTRGELVTSLFDELTDRQLEVLRTAYLAGFFEWPRESTGEEIAEMLDVTQPTVNRHLRIGQQRLLSQLFENETFSRAEGS